MSAQDSACHGEFTLGENGLLVVNAVVLTAMFPCPHQVISAQQLPKVNQKKSSIVDPLVKVEIYGVPEDGAVKETEAVDNNGTCFL